MAFQLTEDDIRFVHFAKYDEDPRVRAAAAIAYEVVTGLVDRPRPEEAERTPADLVVHLIRSTLLQDGGFPDDLTPLTTLRLSNAEYLLGDLVEVLIGQQGLPHSTLLRATRRLDLVVGAVTRDGARPVTMLVNDPNQVVRATDRPWVNGLLTLAHPKDLLVAARRALADEETRLDALRLLAEVGATLGEPRLVDPGTSGDESLYRLVVLGYPKPRDSRQAGDSAPPTRRPAHPRLDTRDQALPGTVFPLKVGLIETIGPRVARPAVFLGPVKPFTLDITLVLDGFTLQGGASPNITVKVTEATPYPIVLLAVRADDDPWFATERTILAIFQTDGRPLGMVHKPVSVEVDRGWYGECDMQYDEWTYDSAAPGPDVEVYVVRGNDAAGRSVLWHVRSKHDGVPHTLEPERIVLDEDVASAAEGGRIAQMVHPRVWEALEAVAARVGGRPTVLFATWDAHIPWERMEVPSAWTEGEPHLGAQAFVVRWPCLDELRSPAPRAV